MPITLPYRFDTSNVWRRILKGAFGLTPLLAFSILFTLLVSRQWAKALGLVVVELVVLYDRPNQPQRPSRWLRWKGANSVNLEWS